MPASVGGIGIGEFEHLYVTATEPATPGDKSEYELLGFETSHSYSSTGETTEVRNKEVAVTIANESTRSIPFEGHRGVPAKPGQLVVRNARENNTAVWFLRIWEEAGVQVDGSEMQYGEAIISDYNETSPNNETTFSGTIQPNTSTFETYAAV